MNIHLFSQERLAGRQDRIFIMSNELKKAYKHVVFFDEKIILSEEISYSELLRLTREVEIEFNQLQIKS